MTLTGAAMRKSLFVFLGVCLMCAMTAFAQTSSDPASTDSAGQPISNGHQNDASPTGGISDQTVKSQSKPEGQSDATTSAGSMGQSTMEGCLTREQSDYVLQSKDAGRVKLSASEDLSSSVGHEVRVHGSGQASSTASGSSNQSPTSSMSGSSDSGQDRTFNVSKVDKVADTCSADSTSSNPK
jgi:hypothetical protein